MHTLTMTVELPSREAASELAYKVAKLIYKETHEAMNIIGFERKDMFGPDNETTYDYLEPFDAGLTFKYTKGA